MKRRNFLELLTLGTGMAAVAPLVTYGAEVAQDENQQIIAASETSLEADLIIAGGGVGGCAAAFAALRNNLTVIMTEETDWIGGQLTQQGVPPDEHQWIETHGSTQLYRDYRKAVREYYRNNYPLTPAAKAKPYLNPGNAVVSELCHEPKVSLAVLQAMMAPYLSTNKLIVLLEHKVIGAEVDGDTVKSLTAQSLQTGNKITLIAPYFTDATEMGDVLPLTETEFVTGTESKAETGELHAPEKGDPNSVQAFTMSFAMDYIHGSNHTIPKPKEYEFWSNLTPKMTPAWSGKLLALAYSKPATLKPAALAFDPMGTDTRNPLNLWHYRRIIDQNNFLPGTYDGGITTVNWPQNDYSLGSLIGASPKMFKHHVDRAKQLSLSLLYWLQTEAPRPDGGKGWPGLRLRKDIMGTEDGLAKYPYIRESRRIKAVFTILEKHVGAENRAMVAEKADSKKAADFYDSVGIGYYHIDLHPATNGTNYVDFESLPFQIPLGALLPIRMKNLLPANKNIGTTHITNGCYRLHPVEWSIGEAVGLLVSYAKQKQTTPHQIRENKQLLTDFQGFIRTQGVATHWPE